MPICKDLRYTAPYYILYTKPKQSIFSYIVPYGWRTCTIFFNPRTAMYLISSLHLLINTHLQLLSSSVVPSDPTILPCMNDINMEQVSVGNADRPSQHPHIQLFTLLSTSQTPIQTNPHHSQQSLAPSIPSSLRRAGCPQVSCMAVLS